jgi:hypothetical protein
VEQSDGQFNATGCVFTIERTGPLGLVALTAAGLTIEGMLQAALNGYLSVVRPSRAAVGDDNRRSTTIRAEASNVADLFTRFAIAIEDRVEALNLLPESIEVDGLVRSDGGSIGWARISLMGGDAGLLSWFMVESATPVTREGYTHSLEIVLRPESAIGST